MSTRSLTQIFDSDGKMIVVVYRQSDGYPSGHGKELAEYLKDITITNGITGREKGVTANGMNCLAAQIIAFFKEEVGGFYLYPAGTSDVGEDYIYKVKGSVEKGITLEIYEADYVNAGNGADTNVVEGKKLFSDKPAVVLAKILKKEAANA